MKVTIESRFVIGDVVDYWGRRGWENMTIYKVDWDKDKRTFKYLMETSNGERYWVEENPDMVKRGKA